MNEQSQWKWFKSSRSAGSRNCVEVAFLPNNLVGVRDSKNPSGPALIFTAAEWSTFTARQLAATSTTNSSRTPSRWDQISSSQR
ncbi:DUF397 domain-containing protein [Nocardia sp. NPDC005998]|uniref:DUF397 domain-containing protein n=1 Tax=Nocardia sp. NPDC005998 TaxID=3156894 RepID=UPI0033B2DC9F